MTEINKQKHYEAIDGLRAFSAIGIVLIYLCHMVMFRVIEKVHCTQLFEYDVLSYVVTAVGTIAGAIVFSLVVKKGLKLVDSIIDKFRSEIA